MKSLKELTPETTVTVSRVTGTRAQRAQLEKLGIMAGTDLTVLSIHDEGLMVSNGRQSVALPNDLLDLIKFGTQFKRTKEPMLLECFCGGGNNTAFLEHFEKVWQERERQCSLRSDDRKEQ